MAARLQQLRSEAVQASEFASKHGCAYYKEFMEKNKHHIVQPPTVEKCSCQSSCFTLVLQGLPLHALCLLGWSVRPELCDGIPGRYESFWKELDGVKHIWRSRNELKVEDAGIAALFGLELYAWFCVGEIVGRGFTFTGYWV